MSCKAAVCLLLIMPATAQPQSFATISIRPSSWAPARSERMQVLPNGDLVAQSVSLLTLVSYAYSVPANPSPRLLGLPDWAPIDRYDIEARAPAGVTPSPQMVRQMLTGHFKLIMHVKNKRTQVYALFIAPAGPTLQQSPITNKQCTFDTAPGGCHTFIIGFGHPLNAKAVNMDDLAHYIENWTDLPVVNHTALKGLFTLNTAGWRPMRLPPPPPGVSLAANPFAGLPAIFTVLQKLGLILKKQEDTVPLYTIEHVERPNPS